MKEIKNAIDPRGIMNPGANAIKLLRVPRHIFDRHLLDGHFLDGHFLDY
jgi:hypothetical protein